MIIVKLAIGILCVISVALSIIALSYIAELGHNHIEKYNLPFCTECLIKTMLVVFIVSAIGAVVYYLQ